MREQAYRGAPEPYRSLGLGDVAYRRGKFEQAAMHFRRATEMDPGQAWGWIGLGRAELTLGNHGAAYDAFTSATWNAPTHPSGWYGRSLAAQRLGWSRTAFESALRSLALGPRDDAAVKRLSNAARHRGGKAAMRHAAQALTQAGRGRSADAMLASASLWADSGAAEQVTAALRDAVKLGALQAELEAAVPPPGDPSLASFLRKFTAGVHARYRHYRATRETESMDSFIAWARNQYEQATGETLEAAGSYASYPFVGQLVDPTLDTDEPLVRRLAERGLLLVIGQRSGGPPEAILARIIRRSPRERVTSRGEFVEREAIWLGQRYISGYIEWAGGGDLAGLALGAVVLVDLHAAARWEGAIRRRRARLRPYAAVAREQAALPDTPVDAVDDPAGVADRLLFDAEVDLAAEVLVHENAHLIDAARYLPVQKNLLRGFGLALSHGFQAEKVVAHLERNAQLTAIAFGPHPRAAFANCCSALGGRGPHAIGYKAIVQGFVNEIRQNARAYPAIDSTRVIVQQLHRLTDDEIRSLARVLASRWDVAADDSKERGSATSASTAPPMRRTSRGLQRSAAGAGRACCALQGSGSRSDAVVDVADYLVATGVPFRTAHGTIDAAVKRRSAIGGTSPKRVRAQLAKWKRRLR